MLVAMSISTCQDIVMEEVQNYQYILHIKVDLSLQEVKCFKDNISMWPKFGWLCILEIVLNSYLFGLIITFCYGRAANNNT